MTDFLSLRRSDLRYVILAVLLTILAYQVFTRPLACLRPTGKRIRR
jgi:hypothetical protein